MNFSFAEALAALGFDAAARIANAVRPPGNYLFNTFLPERNRDDYHVDAANMVVRTTMAGLVGMDSPYPPGGAMTVSSFLENTAKLAISNRLTEEALRELQQMLMRLQVSGQPTVQFMQREALNFLNKVILQALLDRAEWLRAQAMVYGQINWTFNKKHLSVNYGIPDENMLTERTDSNNDAYGDSGSKFWEDVFAARRRLRYNLRAAVLNSVTMDEILLNPVNNIEIISQDNSIVEVVRLVTRGGNTQRDSDARYRMRFVLYDEEAEVLDTTPGATFGGTQTVKFMPDGKIIYVGQNRDSGYRVGTGSTDDPRNDLELGYHHIAPTVEGGNTPGRWARLYVPEEYPMQLVGQGAENSLPVITAPDKIVVATTEIMN